LQCSLGELCQPEDQINAIASNGVETVVGGGSGSGRQNKGKMHLLGEKLGNFYYTVQDVSTRLAIWTPGDRAYRL